MTTARMKTPVTLKAKANCSRSEVFKAAGTPEDIHWRKI